MQHQRYDFVTSQLSCLIYAQVERKENLFGYISEIQNINVHHNISWIKVVMIKT